MVAAKTNHGFTVIEVILFLAVASLMMVGVFVGIGSSVDRQRYNDAVYSFEDYIKGQYNLVDNVRNNRPPEQACTGAGISLGSPQARGTSECTIAGRVVSSSDGREISSRPVFATSSAYDTTGDEAVLLTSLGLIAAPIDLSDDDEIFTVPWRTFVYTDRANKAASRDFSMLIIRLPTNGLTRTYLQDSSAGALGDFWASGFSGDLILCVEPDGLVASEPQGVRVLQGATNSNSVQRITPGDNQC